MSRAALVYLLGLAVYLSGLLAAWAVLFAAFFGATDQPGLAACALAAALLLALLAAYLYGRWEALDDASAGLPRDPEG